VAVSLPKIHTTHETVDIAGSLFDVRVITRAEAARFSKMQDQDAPKDELEMAVISAATDTPLEEVRDWYGATPGWAVEELLGHVKRISRFTEEAQKSGGETDRPGGG
jgi:hypothetical protein